MTNSWSPPKPMSIESVMPSNHLILCLPLLLLPSIFPSIRVFSNESALCIRWPKYWSFSFSISPSNEHPGLISFRMDWLDLLAVQGTVRSLLQHHSSKASILRCSAFFMVQLSHPYMTTGKTMALTRQAFVSNVSASLGHLPVSPVEFPSSCENIAVRKARDDCCGFTRPLCACAGQVSAPTPSPHPSNPQMKCQHHEKSQRYLPVIVKAVWTFQTH